VINITKIIVVVGGPNVCITILDRGWQLF